MDSRVVSCLVYVAGEIVFSPSAPLSSLNFHSFPSSTYIYISPSNSFYSRAVQAILHLRPTLHYKFFADPIYHSQFFTYPIRPHITCNHTISFYTSISLWTNISQRSAVIRACEIHRVPPDVNASISTSELVWDGPGKLVV
jgi:hypothetical protein